MNRSSGTNFQWSYYPVLQELEYLALAPGPHMCILLLCTLGASDRCICYTSSPISLGNHKLCPHLQNWARCWEKGFLIFIRQSLRSSRIRLICHLHTVGVFINGWRLEPACYWFKDIMRGNVVYVYRSQYVWITSVESFMLLVSNVLVAYFIWWDILQERVYFQPSLKIFLEAVIVWLDTIIMKVIYEFNNGENLLTLLHCACLLSTET